MKAFTMRNAVAAAGLLTGFALVGAGATVPSEQVIALGFFMSLAAAAFLIGWNWPTAEPTRPTAKIYQFPVAERRLEVKRSRDVA